MKLLKQSTAATPGIGPFVDTAGAAATGLTLAQTDIVLSKGGSTTYAAKNDATAATHRSGGVYSVPLDATDTATLGPLTIVVAKTGSLPLRDVWTVVAANVYDALVAASDKLQVDAVELNSVAASAANLERSASVIVRGTSTNTGFTATTTIFETDITEATADHYKGRVVVFTSGALLGQATAITAYALNSGRGRFTINSTTEAIPNATTFVIV